MMIVVVNVSLAGVSSSGAITRDWDSAPATEASLRRQQTSARWAGALRFTVRRQMLRGGTAAGQALDGFHSRSHGLGIRLRPAEVAREALKKIFNLMACDRLVVGLVDRLSLPFILLRSGSIWILFGHGNLIADIVGEFAS
jgi:hypothetical protein